MDDLDGKQTKINKGQGARCPVFSPRAVFYTRVSYRSSYHGYTPMHMLRHRFIEYLREHVRVRRFRFLKRYHRRGGERALWKFTEHSVARGVAVGLFFGILTPVAQIVFAIPVAVAVRANVLVAAASTFITNPFVMPSVYYLAYRIGSFLTERRGELAADVAVSEEAAERALVVTDWVATLTDWASSIALPFLVGVVCLAFTAALLGYLLAHAAWGLVAGIRKSRQS